MSFVVKKPGASAVVLDDLGITITGLANSTRDLRDMEAADIGSSADLAAAIAAGDLVVLDPRDDTTPLSISDGELARSNANDTHFGISGGRLSNIDSPATSITDAYTVQFNSTTDKFDPVSVSDVLLNDPTAVGNIVGSMGQDGTDTAFTYNGANTWLLSGQDESLYDNVAPNGTFVGGDGAGGTAYVALDTITLSDGSVITVDAVDGNGDVTQFTVTTSGNTAVTAGVALTQTSTSGSGTSFTLTPQGANFSAGTMQWDVDDVFLRNTGDTLDSGSLTIASGADLVIVDAPVNPTDATNKEYVDSVAAGLDPKESVRYCTVADAGGTYNSTGGTGGTGEITSVDFTDGGIFDGLSGGAINVGDRILVKAQSTSPSIAGFGEAVLSPATLGTDVPALTNGQLYSYDYYYDGVGEVKRSFTYDTGDDYDAIAAKINATLVGDGTGTASFVGGNFRITSNNTGPTSSMQLAPGTLTGGFVEFFGALSSVESITTTFVTTFGTSAALENGIYEVTTAGASGVMERASDHDGSPANEISGGNFTFVEQGTTCQNTGWVLQGDGILTLNSADINWVKFSDSAAINAGVGLSQGGNTFDLDINDTLGTGNAVTSSDLIAFHDGDGAAAGSGSGSQTYARSFSDVLADLDVPNNITSNGIIVRTAADTYASRSIAVDGAGPLDGLAITNGDGVSGNPTVGLDVQNLPVRAAVDPVDRIAVWDSTTNTNVYYTVGDISSSTSSFATWAAAGNTSGDASVVADSATDTVTLTGGTGININFVASTDTLTFSLARVGMADTAVVGADTIPFFDASNSNEPEYRSLTNIISDLSLQTAGYTTIGGDSGTTTASGSDTLNLVGVTNGGITTTASEPGTDQVAFGITPIDLATGSATLALADFIIVSDSVDASTAIAQKYTFQDMVDDLGIVTSISAATTEDLLGIDVTGTVVGLDILGLTDPAAIMAAGDELPIHDKSEGTAGANRKITGQNVADGTADILGITSLTFDTFPAVNTPAEDQTLLAFTDATRSSKVLSVETMTVTFSDNSAQDNDWLSVGNASDALSGFIMPMDGTVVAATAHTEDANGNTYDMDLYVDAVDSGAVVSLTGAGEDSDSDPTIDIDFTAGQKLRIRADQTAGSSKIDDVVVTLTVRWRS